MRNAVTILLPLLVVACAAPFARHEAASIHAPVVYSCEDGLTLSVRFARDGAHVTLPSGEDVFMPKGSGESYADPQHELTASGGQATWKGPTHVPVGCRVRH